MNINRDCFHQSETCRNRYEQIKIQFDSLPPHESIQAIEEFLRESPDHAEAHNDLGVLYYLEGNKLQALGHYEKAVRLFPLNSTFRKNLAGFYFVEMGWTDDAIAIYTDILKSDPADTEVLTALGIISNALGRPDEARIFLRRVIDLEPWNSDARKALADLDMPSTTGMETASTISPDMVMPSDAPETDAILANLRKPAPSQEESSDELYRRALKLADDGQCLQAITALHCLLQQDPDNALFSNDLAVLYSRLEDTANALLYQEKAVGLAPLDRNFRRNLASLYYSSGSRIDDAIALYTRLLKEDAEDIETLSALAIISIDSNRPDEAGIFLNRIVDLDPGNMDARRILEQVAPAHNNGFFLTAG